ncbi:competence protein ComER [Paenibacillus sp. 32O-W]|uniref:late competence protein ComER n=1 Tax=Paenibacillus sp. 32O-W TaxID=1695218 RepID=UPI0007212706|nr:late competence protein ComER [Paenibacillus sp. 32O-W]ALS27255.1 competence protein ComER [Paenibacillus sp. 32O-W]
MNVGFIGTGSMGSLLIEAFVSSGALTPGQIAASNRTYAKAARLAACYPGLKAVTSNAEAAIGRDIVFLCVKPHEFKTVIDELRSVAAPEQLFVSITSPVMIKVLEDQLPSKIAKVIPSITNRVRSGASLCIYGTRTTDEDRARLENLLGFISVPLHIDERYTRIVSDLSSCGPAFISYVLQCFVDAAVEETGIDREQALAVATAMLRGTGELLTAGGMTPEQIQQRVAVPGGITAEALQLMERELDGVFGQVIRTTHAKFREDLEKIGFSFYGEEVNGL